MAESSHAGKPSIVYVYLKWNQKKMTKNKGKFGFNNIRIYHESEGGKENPFRGSPIGIKRLAK